MSPGLLIEYLNNSNALQRAQTLLKDLCGLDILLIDAVGKNIVFNTSTSQNQFFSRSNILKSLLNRESELEVTVPQDYLDHVSEAREAVDFVSKDGLVKIIVPIIYKEQVVGFLLACENQTFRLNRSQINSMKAFLNESLRQVVNNDFKFFSDFKASNDSHQKKTLYRVTQFINENFKEASLSLNEVSKKNNISYFYLSHLFKKELKTTFSKYLINLRMDAASRLLKDRSLTVSQVSHSSGFEDPGYFSKVFKKHHGSSPAVYRNKVLTRKKNKDI